MKRLILCLSAMIMLCLASCRTGNFASSGGLEDVAYIALTSSDNMANKEVEVRVDDNTVFTAKVQRAKQNQEKRQGKLYAIAPGRRHVDIYYQGNKIYSQEIFVSSQHTKTINL